MNHLERKKKEILNILNEILNVPGSFGILNNVKKEKALKEKLENELSSIWKKDDKDSMDVYAPLLDLTFKQLIMEIIVIVEINIYNYIKKLKYKISSQ